MAGLMRVLTKGATVGSKMTTDLYDEGYWERGEGSNYSRYGNDPHWPATIDTLKAALPANVVAGSWLEVACAKGYFVLEARARGLNVVGVDLSEYAISKALPEVQPHVRVGTVLDLPYGDGEFDVLVAWEFMEHIPEEDLGRAVREMLRVTRPGAYLIYRIGISDPSPAVSGATYEQHDHSHFHEVPSSWWRDDFASRGWDHLSDVEVALNTAHAGVDWVGRFFAYRTPLYPSRQTLDAGWSVH